MQLFKLVKANTILESIAAQKLNINLSYKIMKFIKLASPEVEFYRKKANEIINKYSVKDENGNPTETISDIEAVNKEGAELNNTEVEFPNIKFKLEELQELQLSAVDLLSLDDFIEEE